MNIDDWLQWPTRSTDPGVNFVVIILLMMMFLIALVVGATFLLPVVIIFAIAKGVHWYVNRPVPTDQLYTQTQQRVIAANFPTPEQFLHDFTSRFVEAVRPHPPIYTLVVDLLDIADTLYKIESLNNPIPPAPSLNTIEEGRYRDRLLAFQHKTMDAPRTLEVLTNTLFESFLSFSNGLPPLARTTSEKLSATDTVEPFATFPLIDIMPNAAGPILALAGPFTREDVRNLDLFAPLRQQLLQNWKDASGNAKELISPEEFKGTPPATVQTFLQGTPLQSVFYTPVPFDLEDQYRFEHTHIVGGSGHGKTNAILHLISRDLDRVAKGECSIVVIDSQNQIIPTIANLKLFAEGQPLHGKLVLVDPSDIEYPVQLNLFSIGTDRIDSYSALERERLLNSTIELYDFVLSALLDAEMTARQGTLFRFATQLMMVIPDATIHTFRELMQPGGFDKYKPYIDKLEGTAKEFFETQFTAKIFEQTKQQVVARLFTLCESRTFERLFTHPKSKLDLFTEINAGKVILINTAKDLLKQQGTEVFGRFFLAMIGQAAQERATLKKKLPVFCYIDECQDYIATDSNFTVILEQARKQKIGMIVAHQYLTQLSPRTLDSLYANTSIKFAGGVSDKDAYALARNMQTEPAFIMQQSKGTFATYVRNYTKNALSLKFPLSDMARQPHMSTAEQAAVRSALRSKYAVPIAELQQARAKTSAPKPDDPKEFADRY